MKNESTTVKQAASNTVAQMLPDVCKAGKPHRRIGSSTAFVAKVRDLAMGTEHVDKRGLALALGLVSTRIIDQWVRKKMITSYRLGHRTLLFRVNEVIEDLARFRVNAVGRKS